MEKQMILLQLNHSRSYYSKPHDSTIGAGPGFYLFGLLVLLFIVGGTLKAFWDDKNWKGRVYNLKGKRRNLK